MSAPAALGLRDALAALRRRHGNPAAPPTSDPFELVLFENIAYLATGERRRQAFALLRETIGTTPPAILAARKAALERVTAHGILKARFADKLRECARIAIERFGGDLAAALPAAPDAARRALRRFPGIGEPGADRILLFSRRLAVLAPESNGLRVLARLGFIAERASYAQTYTASRAIDRQLPARIPTMQQAHLLLHEHGSTLCLRAAPRCGDCPLASRCRHALAGPAAKTDARRRSLRR